MASGIRAPIVNEVLHRMTKSDDLTDEEVKAIKRISMLKYANQRMIEDLQANYAKTIQAENEWWAGVQSRLGLTGNTTCKADYLTKKITWEEKE